jgi:hypothetical protein
MKIVNALRPIVLSTLLTGLTIFAGQSFAEDGGSFGGGGLTYTSGFEEARQIAINLMNSTSQLKGVTKDLQNTYSKKRAAWIDALTTYNRGRSIERLYVEKKEKAAVANIPTFSVVLNIPFLEENRVSLYQLIVLVVHESGHLAQVMLSHDDLDEIGIAIANMNLSNQDGILVMKAPGQNFVRSHVVMVGNSGNSQRALLEDLDSKILFQDAAKKQIAENFTNGNQPRVLLFVGPFGLGKVYTAEILAAHLKVPFKMFPMAQFSSFDEASFFGAPPGYVGYDANGGQFVRWAKENPASVVLMSEVDKLNPEFFQEMFNWNENEMFKDRLGAQAHFQKTTFVLTTDFMSSLVTAYDRKYRNVPADPAGKERPYSGYIPTNEMELRAEILNRLQADPHFSAAIGGKINVNSIIVFHNLTIEERVPFVKARLKQLIGVGNLIHGYPVQIDDSVFEYISKTVSFNYIGHVEEALRSLIISPAAATALYKNLPAGSKIKISIREGASKSDIEVVQ